MERSDEKRSAAAVVSPEKGKAAAEERKHEDKKGTSDVADECEIKMCSDNDAVQDEEFDEHELIWSVHQSSVQYFAKMARLAAQDGKHKEKTRFDSLRKDELEDLKNNHPEVYLKGYHNVSTYGREHAFYVMKTKLDKKH